MPYYARKHQLQHALLFHLYNRSNGKKEVFHCDADYHQFINLLITYSSNNGISVYHWAIMPNHYHLLLELEDPALLSSCMAGLHRAYSCYHHRLYRSAGFLWQGRFKLQAVQKEGYLVACGRYIERNPVRAGLVIQASDYFFSSAAYYCLGRDDGLTHESPVFKEFGSDLLTRRIRYSEFLRNFDKEEESCFSNLSNPQGNAEFVRRLVMSNGRYLPQRRGRPRQRIVS